MHENGSFVSPFLAVTRIARSLYGGPLKQRKQITNGLDETFFTSDAWTIVQALNSEHAAVTIVREAMQKQMLRCGTVTIVA
jgi:hypothetical protein